MSFVENITNNSKHNFDIFEFDSRPFYCNVGASQRSGCHSALKTASAMVMAVMPLLFYISLLDQGDSLTCYELANQAACNCQEEADSVAGSAIPHLFT